eukprot:GEMP01011237.1.p1 GENE.GEMP01011237.1~~GEMP01011237.1.p1  ORF type:complete len:199 (+),score=21.12 GEMP01011237.1:159-755(+)
MRMRATKCWLLIFGAFEIVVGFSFAGWRYWYRYANYTEEQISYRIIHGLPVPTNYGLLPLVFGTLAIIFGQGQILAVEKLDTCPNQRTVAYLYALRVVSCIIAGVLAFQINPSRRETGAFSILIFYIFLHIVYSLGLFQLRKQINSAKARNGLLIYEESSLERMHRNPDEYSTSYLNGTMAHGGPAYDLGGPAHGFFN